MPPVVDRKGKDVLVANYAVVAPECCRSRTTAASKRLAASFSIAAPASIDSARKGLMPTPSMCRGQPLAFVADLDSIRFSSTVLMRVRHADRERSASAGSRPVRSRHFAFHPNGKWAWVINEMANTVTRFDYDEERGTLQPRESVSSLPKGFSGTSYTAEVQVHPSGKFLYGSIADTTALPSSPSTNKPAN